MYSSSLVLSKSKVDFGSRFTIFIRTAQLSLTIVLAVVCRDHLWVDRRSPNNDTDAQLSSTACVFRRRPAYCMGLSCTRPLSRPPLDRLDRLELAPEA